MLESVLLDPKLLAPETIRPLSRREYERLVDAGWFHDERVELLRGQLVAMSPQGEAHSTITARLVHELVLALDRSYDVRSHSPFAATNDSEPEPDISVSRRLRRNRYHPSKALLLIEVAESSLRKDRNIKAAIYAENCAPEYWIVDVRARSVHVHRRPVHGVYQHVAQLRGRAALQPIHLPQLCMTVAQLFRL